MNSRHEREQAPEQRIRQVQQPHGDAHQRALPHVDQRRDRACSATPPSRPRSAISTASRFSRRKRQHLHQLGEERSPRGQQQEGQQDHLHHRRRAPRWWCRTPGRRSRIAELPVRPPPARTLLPARCGAGASPGRQAVCQRAGPGLRRAAFELLHLVGHRLQRASQALEPFLCRGERLGCLRHPPADRTRQRQAAHHRDSRRTRPAPPRRPPRGGQAAPLQPADDGSQQAGEQHRERDRHQQFAPEHTAPRPPPSVARMTMPAERGARRQPASDSRRFVIRCYASHLFTASVTLCPPKPNEFDSATSTRRSTFRFGRAIEIAPRVGRELVDRRRDDAAGGHQQRHPELERARAAEQVPRHATWSSRTPACAACSPNTALTASVSATSPCVGRGAVGVDVAHVLGIDLAVREAGPHRPLGALRRARPGDVMW